MKKALIFAAVLLSMQGWCVEGPVATSRRRLAPRTLVFAETITHYGVFQNYLHYWIDRPLFWDRSMRHAPGKFCFDTFDSFRITRREARKYGLDGLGVFGNYGSRLRSFNNFCSWNERAGQDGFMICPMALFSESGINYVPDPKDFSSLILAAQASGCCPKIDGRHLIASYNARMLKPEARRKLNEGIRAAVGNDRYLLMGDLENRGLQRLQKAFRENGCLSEQEMKDCVALVREALDVSDGLHLRFGEYVRPADGPYTSYIDTSFMDKCLKPVLLDLYARPEYSGKILGMYIIQGYINHLSGMNHGEFGTATLRRMMDSALALDPDYLMLFEWNEQNENTMFQPTVYNGQSIGRIIRWYMDRLRGGKPAPYEGDDPSVPNIVLSHRVVCKPGEKIEFEILGIPSGEKTAYHDVQLSLLSADGTSLAGFPQTRLSTTALDAVVFDIPAESLPVGTSVMPRLTVDGVTYEGFHPLRVDATICRNFKCVRQSLRDLPKMSRREFSVERTAPGEYSFTVDVAAGEPLSSLEVVCDEDEIAAFDPSGEYDRAKYDILYMSITTAPRKGGRGPIEIRFKGAPGATIRQDWKANIDPGAVVPVKGQPDTYRIRTYWWAAEVGYFLSLPKDMDASAEMEITADASLGGGKVSIPLRTVLSAGAYGAVLSPERGFRVDVERFDALCDLPPPLGVNDIAWKGKVRTGAACPNFHLRAVTKAGHVWRSRVVVPSRPSGATERRNVFSETTKGVKPVEVPMSLVPDIDYEFTPETGAMLMPRCGDTRFAATLGGGTVYSGAFGNERVYKDMPADRDSMPAWVRDGEAWTLRFDGTNDYVHLPIEFFPLGQFDLRMTFRPEGCDVNRTLFRHAGLWRGSLQLFLVKKRLYAMWAARELGDPKNSTGRFDTGLDVVEGEWNDLEVTYDFRKLTFRLGGREKSFPYDRRAYVFRPSVFGGHNVTADIAPRGPLHFFKGGLRKLKIRH